MKILAVSHNPRDFRIAQAAAVTRSALIYITPGVISITFIVTAEPIHLLFHFTVSLLVSSERNGDRHYSDYRS